MRMRNSGSCIRRGEATTAKIAWCSPVATSTGVYYGGSFKLGSMDTVTVLVVTHRSLVYTHVNYIFRTVCDETPAQRSFSLQACQ